MEGLTNIKWENFVVTLQNPIMHCSVIISNAGDGDRNISLPWLLTEQKSNATK